MKERLLQTKELVIQRLRNFWRDESGMGTVEVILIIVVLVGLVIVFKQQTNGLVQNIFESIRKGAKDVTG